MPQRPRKEQPNKSKKSESYRLVVFRSEDFQEIKSFDLTLSNIYVISSIVILTIITLLVLLIAFTPIKKLVPGYGQIEATQGFLQLVDGVDELEVKIESQGTYINALRRLLTTGLSDDQSLNLTEALNDSKNLEVKSTDLISENTLKPEKSTSNRAIQTSDYWSSLSDARLFNPVNGLISSDFDPVIKHFGVDILAPAQTPVVTIMDGFVFSSGWDLETGYTIGIQHEDNFLSFYKHNSQLLKEKGTFVRAGEAVAIIGNTGTLSNGPHLHFELWHNGKPINPIDIINFN